MKLAWVVVLLASAGCKENEKPPQRDPDPSPAREAPKPDPIEKPSRVITSPLPEQGPHPEYPTAAAAGTDKIFFLEEPDRGPKAPATYTPPARSTLTWTTAPFCTTGPADSVCSAGPAGKSQFRIGRAKGITIVEEVFGNRVEETTVYLAKPDGSRDMRLRIDAMGDVIDARLFTQPGKYTGRNLDGGNALAGCGMLAYTEDKAKRLTELRCLQWLGEPMRDTSGVAITKYSRDAAGFVTSERNFGIDGAPVANTRGVHNEVSKRDALGRIVLTQRFDVAGNRVVDADGCAGERRTYDKDGLLEETTCLAKNDGPIPDGDGVTIRRSTYDDNGCLVGVRHRRAGGEDATDHRKRQGFAYARDEHCNLLGQTCLGETGKPAACGPGEPATIAYTLDARGRAISTKHFAADGSPTGDARFHVHELRSAYDALGNEVDTSCWDLGGAAVACGTTGFHGKRQTFDDAGREISETFVDTSGGPGTNLGISERRHRYDNYDHVYETRWLDSTGNTFVANGSALQHSLWDATHRLFAYLLLDADGKPAKYAGCYAGVTCPTTPWHALRIYRRPNGRVESNKFFDAEGQLLETIDCAAKPCLD